MPEKRVIEALNQLKLPVGEGCWRSFWVTKVMMDDDSWQWWADRTSRYLEFS